MGLCVWLGLGLGLGVGLGIGLGLGLRLGLGLGSRGREVGHPRHVVRAEQHVLGLEVEVDDVVRVHGLGLGLGSASRLGLELGFVCACTASMPRATPASSVTTEVIVAKRPSRT